MLILKLKTFAKKLYKEKLKCDTLFLSLSFRHYNIFCFKDNCASYTFGRYSFLVMPSLYVFNVIIRLFLFFVKIIYIHFFF